MKKNKLNTSLLDSFIESPNECLNGRWYKEKPEIYKKGHYTFSMKIKAIIDILYNKAIGVHFGYDRESQNEK